MKAQRLRHWPFLVGLALLLLAVDQGTKWLVIRNLAVGESWAPIPALSKVFTITHVQNTGVSFGQLPGLGWLFMLVNAGVLIAIFLYYPRIPAGFWQLRFAAGLILAGDLGNVTDRLRTAFQAAAGAGSLWSALPSAYVTDFFNFQVWPVFNVADLCTVTGTAILAWTLWRTEKTGIATDAMASDSQ